MLVLEQLNLDSSQEKLSLEKNLEHQYPLQSFNEDDIYNEYTENDIFESEADDILDFSESNPFGTF